MTFGRIALLLACGCQLVTSFELEPVEETTAALCDDGKDNDFDGLSDCQDWGCVEQPRCCTIPELLLYDDFESGPADCAECAAANCVSPICLPDDSRWHTWPCPFPTVCGGALHIDKDQCFTAGVLGNVEVPLQPGLELEVGFRGQPEALGYLRVGLTLQDEGDFPGSLDPCSGSQTMRALAAIHQVSAEGGYELQAYFRDERVGATAPMTAEGMHVASLSIDLENRLIYEVDGVPFASASEPLPPGDLTARVAIVGLTHTATIDFVKLQAGLRCAVPHAWTLAGADLTSSQTLNGSGEAGTFDGDEVYNPMVLPGPSGLELFYTGCDWRLGEECDERSYGIGHAVQDGSGFVRDGAGALIGRDALLAGGSLGKLSVDILRTPALLGLLAPGDVLGVLELDEAFAPAGQIFARGGPGQWDRNAICCTSSLVAEDGTIMVWYSGRGSAQWEIGLATSQGGGAFVKHPENPVLRQGPPGSFTAEGLLAPTVIFDRDLGLYRMWYEAHDFYGQQSIGYAVSPDGVHWFDLPSNPVITADELGGLEEMGGPAVVQGSDGALRMWLHGSTDDPRRRRIYELVNRGTPAP